MDTRELVCYVLCVLIVVAGIVAINDRNRTAEEKMLSLGYSQVLVQEGSAAWTWRKE